VPPIRFFRLDEWTSRLESAVAGTDDAALLATSLICVDRVFKRMDEVARESLGGSLVWQG